MKINLKKKVGKFKPRKSPSIEIDYNRFYDTMHKIRLLAGNHVFNLLIKIDSEQNNRNENGRKPKKKAEARLKWIMSVLNLNYIHFLTIFNLMNKKTSSSITHHLPFKNARLIELNPIQLWHLFCRKILKNKSRGKKKTMLIVAGFRSGK